MSKYESKFEIPEIFCVICRAPIPDEMVLRKAVTCSKEHAIELKNRRRRKRTTSACKYCHSPSSPEERRLFVEWRKTQPGYFKRRGPKKRKKEEPKEAPHTEVQSHEEARM